ncbi:AAA family ATPase [Synechococcus sp. CS-1329]|uniref:AAA domain-containing protein n=1 Tax=Synechococcus sp. CS-1329 TaxID=2847975 RepID=UPI00223B0724|nr:AAA domain-containing protein [Synechococcus sp. CS-1329]MCT0219502.1 AAA family ATPase [Synechococcus sp. CS-1329]
MKTLERLLESVFSGKKFESEHPPVQEEQIFKVLARLPYSLSKSQRTAIYRALSNDISYIQGPPGTGKSFTISALAIAASELGLKVLVASQKTPAVDIVYEKVTEVLGDAACLYISDDQQRKQNTRGIIDRLLSKATDYQTTSEESELKRLSEHVDTLVAERLDYAKRIQEYESELRRYYDTNQVAQDSRQVLKEDFGLPEITVKKINLLQGNESREKAKVLLNECRSIREESRKLGGTTTLEKGVRLKILSNAVLRALDFEIEYYKKHQEEVLVRSLTYSSNLADAQSLQRVIKGQPLEVTRRTFDRRNSELYPKNPKESVLAHYLASHHSVRINTLLQGREYRDALDAFHRRLRWKNARRVRLANAKINFDLLFEMFPIVMGEIKSLHPYLPFKEETIDLLILDEASQVNLAEIFPILFRAKRFCIVGDHNQLGIKAGGVIFISKVFEKLTWQKQFAGLPGYPLDFKSAQERDLLVSESSILDLIRNDLNPVTAAPVLLNEHFRSLPMLAEFTSEQFYKDESPESGLRIMTAVPDKKALNAFMDIEVASRREENSQINKGEVEKAFEVILSFAKQAPTDLTKEVFGMPQLVGKSISLGVVCFIRDQVNYMKEEVLRRLTDEQQERISLMIGTPEEFQGNERDVMIFTPAIDEEQKRSKAFMEDRNRFNVATSRAKFYKYFIHGKLPSNMILMQQMLTKMGQGKSEIKEMDKGHLPIGWTYKKSECDSDFELVIADVLEDLIVREYPNRLTLYNQVRTCGFRLDFVVYDRTSKRAVGIEVDGKYHYLDNGSSYTDEHLERANALKRADWVIKYLPYWNWFQDGWIERDAAAANELRQFIRDFFR